MLFFTLIAFMNGIVSVINKMINLRAKQFLGTANGTLINYLEASVISLLIIFITGSNKLTNLALLHSVPPVYFLGGFFGLISMILILNGMAKTQIAYSTVLILIGQLGTGLLIDFVVAGKVEPMKIIGILLVIAGVVLDINRSGSPKEKSKA